MMIRILLSFSILGAAVSGCGQQAATSSVSSSDTEVRGLIDELIKVSNLPKSDYEKQSGLSYSIWKNRKIALPMINEELRKKHSFSATNSLISLAGNIADESSIPVVADYLSGQASWTEGSAAMSLALIGTENAKKVAFEKLKETYAASGRDVFGAVKSAGYLRIKEAVPLLQAILSDNDPKGSYNPGLLRHTMSALGRIGDSSSLKALKEIAKMDQSSFAEEAKEAIELINLAARGQATIYKKDKKRFHLNLFSHSEKGRQVYDPSIKKWQKMDSDKWKLYYAKK